LLRIYVLSLVWPRECSAVHKHINCTLTKYFIPLSLLLSKSHLTMNVRKIDCCFFDQCLKYKTDQAQEAKKMEKLNNIFFTLMARGPEGMSFVILCWSEYILAFICRGIYYVWEMILKLFSCNILVNTEITSKNNK
jgi:hypothetical protein